MKNISIQEINLNEFNEFLSYLKIHLDENGSDNTLFQPLSKKQMQIDIVWEEKFKGGFNKAFAEKGWRKLWLAKSHDNQILGHIDIRSRNELNTRHRVLLGMGVDSNFRKLKIGQQLLERVIQYCKNDEEIAWLDLEVLTNNTAAIGLYKKYDFTVLANCIDMFRIEGKSYDYTSMTLRVG